jgi:hypothetical protein
MMDYWISFVVTQDPNDGKGTQRPNWPQFTPSNKVCISEPSGFATVADTWVDIDAVERDDVGCDARQLPCRRDRILHRQFFAVPPLIVKFEDRICRANTLLRYRKEIEVEAEERIHRTFP